MAIRMYNCKILENLLTLIARFMCKGLVEIEDIILRADQIDLVNYVYVISFSALCYCDF